MGTSRSTDEQPQTGGTTIMRIQATHSSRNKWPLIVSLSITVGLSLFAIPSHATVDWDEGFEYAGATVNDMNNAMDTVWGSSCAGNSVIMAPTTQALSGGGPAPHSGQRCSGRRSEGTRRSTANPPRQAINPAGRIGTSMPPLRAHYIAGSGFTCRQVLSLTLPSQR